MFSQIMERYIFKKHTTGLIATIKLFLFLCLFFQYLFVPDSEKVGATSQTIKNTRLFFLLDNIYNLAVDA